MADFVERNLATLRKKEWAKDLLYKVEGEGEEQQGESDGKAGRANAAVRASPNYPSTAVATPTSDRPHSAGVASKTKVAEPSTANRARVANVHETISDSEASSQQEREERKKRKHKDGSKKRKSGLLGYDYFDQMKNMTPEVMMMNQMMGMSMMMQNPLAIMGAAASMSPYQMQMMSGMKQKKDENQRS